METIKVINNVWNMSPESAAPATRLPTFYVSVCLLTSGDSHLTSLYFQNKFDQSKQRLRMLAVWVVVSNESSS